MKSKLKEAEFKARCWDQATGYLKALDKEHIVNMIEYSIRQTYGDTKES